MKHPSPTAKVAPIGTRYSAIRQLGEQRSGHTYHDAHPWPDDEADRLQAALLRRHVPLRAAVWVYVAMTLAAVGCAFAL